MIDLSKNLKEFNNAISASYPNVYSVMIYQNDRRIFENYYRKAKPDDRRSIMSCNKSILSALTGIAIDKNFIEGVDQHILDFFPEYLHVDSDPNILHLRIKHLLTMTTGFYYQRLAGDSQPVYARGESYNDIIQYILDLPIVNSDLNTFCYSNFEYDLLYAVIAKASGMTTVEFANKYLFSELGFEYIDSDEYTTHEMADFGLLYLNNGYYNERQIISKEWVGKSKKNYGNGYGYMWWVNPDGSYMASGAGGAMILIVPNENAVVVSQTKHLKANWVSPFNTVKEFLLK